MLTEEEQAKSAGSESSRDEQARAPSASIGRCLKTVLDDDPLKCREGHDRPKSEVLCCSMHKLGDLLYNKGFTKCRSLVGFPPGCGNECEYSHGEAGHAFPTG